MLQGGTGEQ